MKNSSQRGFTLVELLIVVTIIGILSYIAVGSFGQGAIKANRTDARSTLLRTASTLEKCKAVYGTYDNENCSIDDGDTIDSPEGLYRISVDSTPRTFDLTAEPVASKAQANDDDCRSLSLNHQGKQTATGDDTSQCW